MAKRTFSVFHLLWLSTSICLILAVFQFSYALAIPLCPIAIAPPIAHAQSPTRRSILTSVYSAFKWLFPFFVVLALHSLKLYADGNWSTISEGFALTVLFAVVIASAIGGYFGTQSEANDSKVDNKAMDTKPRKGQN